MRPNRKREKERKSKDDDESEGGECKGESDNITSKCDGMGMGDSTREKVKLPVSVRAQVGVKARGSQQYYKRV